MNQATPKKYSPTLLGAAIGLPIGICLYVLIYVLTFAAGTSLVAYVFPFAIIANPGFYDPWWLTLFFALIQFPVYGAACGFVWARKRDAVWIAVGCLVFTHIAGLAGATSRWKTYDEQRATNPITLATKSLRRAT